MPKIKNVSGRDLIVPALGGRLVIAGQVVEVADGDVYGFTCQAPNWEPADESAKKTHNRAHRAEQKAAQPEPEPPAQAPDESAPKEN